ncbi:ADP-ribose pyrophosphatase [Thalassocella blandensis]|nr:ADP-ribose pyrophosphatase [Thalassocella blandensis]
MKNLDARYTRKDVEIQQEEVAYNGFFSMFKLRLKHRLFNGGWSAEMTRELFHRGEAAAAVLYDPKHDLIGLVEQFRIGAIESEFGPWCLEVVAGMRDKDESPEALILREIKEEAGINDAELIHISSYYSTPGGCSEKIYLYCALCDLSQAGGVHGLDDENEDILLHTFAADEVFPVMLNSRANNAATLIGLQWLQINRERLRKE